MILGLRDIIEAVKWARSHWTGWQQKRRRQKIERLVQEADMREEEVRKQKILRLEKEKNRPLTYGELVAFLKTRPNTPWEKRMDREILEELVKMRKKR